MCGGPDRRILSFMTTGGQKRAFVIVGHGAPAKDTPPEKVRRLRALEGERRRTNAHAMLAEEVALDHEVRRWPRTDTNDPYRAGIERLAERVRNYAKNVRVEIAYNEFCAPSLPECVAELVRDGCEEIVLVATMMTPGGVHSEVEIPEIACELREAYPNTRIVYAWPFDLDTIARVLVDQASSFVSK